VAALIAQLTGSDEALKLSAAQRLAIYRDRVAAPALAAGLKAAGFKGPVVSVIGDSTFLHSGVQPLIEAIHKKLDVVVMILDNSTVAMTGHQTTPADALSDSGREMQPVLLEQLVKGLGVEKIYKMDAYEPRKLTESVKEALGSPGVSVIIVERACAILTKRGGEHRTYSIVPDLCTGCDVCTNLLGCPALTLDGDKVRIIEEDCVGCSLCAGVCPYKAIIEVKEE